MMSLFAPQGKSCLVTTILTKIARTSVDGVAVLMYGVQNFVRVALGAIFEAIRQIKGDGASVRRFGLRS